MSTAEDGRRAKWGYESSTPICATCSGYRKAAVTPHAKGPTLEPPLCVPGRSHVTPGGCCNKWRDKKTGERLA